MTIVADRSMIPDEITRWLRGRNVLVTGGTGLIGVRS